MKDKEKQVFDKYGNYDFPTDIKQEGLNTATTQIEEMAIRLPTIEEIEKDYKEWCVNLIKVRFDLKPEYYDEHHHDNYTYENCADCLWNRIKGTIEELLWLKEDYCKLREQLILWKGRAEQASKETAKEICDLILKHWQGHDLVECDWLIVAISEKYGVDMK